MVSMGCVAVGWLVWVVLVAVVVVGWLVCVWCLPWGGGWLLCDRCFCCSGGGGVCWPVAGSVVVGWVSVLGGGVGGRAVVGWASS